MPDWRLKPSNIFIAFINSKKQINVQKKEKYPILKLKLKKEIRMSFIKIELSINSNNEKMLINIISLMFADIWNLSSRKPKMKIRKEQIKNIFSSNIFWKILSEFEYAGGIPYINKYCFFMFFSKNFVIYVFQFYM